MLRRHANRRCRGAGQQRQPTTGPALAEQRREEEALRASEERFRLLAENAQDVIFETRLKPTRAQDYISPAVTKTLGYTPEDFYADPDLPLKIVFPADRPLLEDIWADPVRFSGHTHTFRFRRKDGAWIWMERRITPVCDQAGNVVAVQGILRDVTERKRLEEELRASEERYRILAETASEAIIMIDVDSKILFVNPATEKIFGYRPKEILGHNLTILMPPDLRPRHLAALHRYVETGRRHLNWQGVELLGLRKNGQTVPLEIAFGELVWDGRRLFIGYVRDITERKRAEEERERLIDQLAAERSWLQTVIERAAAGIILYRGTRGERAVANRRAEEFFGRPITSVEGARRFAGQIHHLDGTPYKFEDLASLRALRGQIVLGEEAIIRKPSGQELSILASAAPIRDPEGKIIGAVVVLEDITEIKELEREREEWTSVIAHDLRQPVTVIDGYAKLLLRHADQLPVPMRAQVGHILTSVSQLNRMIADLLDVSRLEARRLTLDYRQVDFPTLVRAVVEQVAEVGEPSGPRHAVRLRIAGEIPPLEIDPDRIEQVLDNLLSNAAKYSYPDTDIIVQVERRDAAVEVAVTNEGPGIAPDELPKLFRRYYRTKEAQASRERGIGLGLYITKGLVEAHRGSIWVASIPGQTTTFYFTLPLRPTSA